MVQAPDLTSASRNNHELKLKFDSATESAAESVRKGQMDPVDVGEPYRQHEGSGVVLSRQSSLRSVTSLSQSTKAIASSIRRKLTTGKRDSGPAVSMPSTLRPATPRGDPSLRRPSSVTQHGTESHGLSALKSPRIGGTPPHTGCGSAGCAKSMPGASGQNLGSDCDLCSLAIPQKITQSNPAETVLLPNRGVVRCVSTQTDVTEQFAAADRNCELPPAEENAKQQMLIDREAKRGDTILEGVGTGFQYIGHNLFPSHRYYSQCERSLRIVTPPRDQPIFNDSTFLSATKFDQIEWDANSNELVHRDEIGFLAFQRPDKWIQLALFFEDEEIPTILLDPIAEGVENTPLVCSLIEDEEDLKGLLVFFIMQPCGEIPHMAACRVTIHRPGLLVWAVETVSITDVKSAKPLSAPRTSMPFRHNNGFLTFATSSNGVVTISTRVDGEYITVRYPEHFQLAPGDEIFHSMGEMVSETEKQGVFSWFRSAQEETSPWVRVYRVQRDNITRLHLDGRETWVDISAEDHERITTTTKPLELHWGEKAVETESMVYELVRGADGLVWGLLVQLGNNDIYLFRGHPWREELKNPTYICATKPGTRFHFSADCGDLFYISHESQLLRIRLEGGTLQDAAIGNPVQVLSQRLKDPSYRNLMFEGV